MAARRFRVLFQEQEDGTWLVSVPEVLGCHTDGATRDDARARIREALAACVDVLGADAEGIARDAAFDEVDVER